MPRYRIHDQQTGQTLVVEGDAPPSEQDAAELFESHYATQRAPIAEGVGTALAAVGIPAPVTRALLTQGGMVGDAAARIAPPIVGQIAGARVAGLPGMVVGGMLGGVGGEALAQGREFLRGERNEPSVGQGVAAAIASGIPLPALRFTGPVGETARQRATKVLGQAVAQRAVQGGGINVVAEGTRQVIDEGELDAGNLALAFGLGAGIGGVLGGVEGALLPRQVLAQIRRTPEFRNFQGTDEELIAAVRRRMAGPPPVVDAPPEIPATMPTPEPPPVVPTPEPPPPTAGGPGASVEDILGLTPKPPPTPTITPDLPTTAAPSAPVATAVTPSGSSDILPDANPPAGAEGTPPAVEPAAAAAPLATDYADFKAKYLATYQRMMTAAPEQVGARESANQLAALADAHPDWAAAVEAEVDLAPTPPELQPPAAQPAAPAAPTGAAAPEQAPAPRAGQEGAPGNGGDAEPTPEAKIGKKSILHPSQELAVRWIQANPRLRNVAMTQQPDGQWRVTFDTKGARRRIEASPTGVPDILDWIQDRGGVPGPKRGETGGHYNEFSEIFSGKYRALVRGGRGGLDTWIKDLAESEWPHLAEDVEGFKSAVRAAIAQREKVGAQFKAQEVEAKFMTAALDPNKGRGPKEPRGLDQQPTDMLKTGDKGEIKKRDFTVDSVDPEGTVTLKDGPEVPPLKIPPGTTVHFDKDTFKPAPVADDAMDFLPPDADEPDAPAVPAAPASPEVSSSPQESLKITADDLPPGVRAQVFSALEVQQDVERIIREQRGGPRGHHAQLAKQEQAPRLEGARAILDEFRAHARANGFDAELVLRDLATWRRPPGQPLAFPIPPEPLKMEIGKIYSGQYEEGDEQLVAAELRKVERATSDLTPEQYRELRKRFGEEGDAKALPWSATPSQILEAVAEIKAAAAARATPPAAPAAPTIEELELAARRARSEFKQLGPWSDQKSQWHRQRWQQLKADKERAESALDAARREIADKARRGIEALETPAAPASTPPPRSDRQEVSDLTAELGMADLGNEYQRPPELVQKLQRLGTLLLPGVRTQEAERLAVLHLLQQRGEVTPAEVGKYRDELIRGGYVARPKETQADLVDDMPFNLAGEQQAEAKSALELAAEAEEAARIRAEQEKRQLDIFSGPNDATPNEKAAQAAADATTTPPAGQPAAGFFESAMTPDEIDELRRIEEALKKKLGQINSGIDPEYFALGAKMALLYAKAGARRFKDFARIMLERFGDKARPYLLAWYENMRASGKLDVSLLDHAAEAERIYNAEFSHHAAAGGRAVSGAAGSGSGKRTPVARVVRQELIPQPRSIVGADTYAANAGFRLDADQILGANAILTHFERNPARGAFLLGDGTGFGKTAQILAVIDQYRRANPGARVLYVTQNRQMLAGSWSRDSQRMGIDLSGVDALTYDGLKTKGATEYDLAVFDEAHNLKNGESLKAMAQARVEARHKLFATATPMDRPTGAAYFLAEVTGMPEDKIAADLGYKFQTREDPITRELHTYAVLTEGNTWATVWSHIMQHRDAAIMAGAMLRREYPFYGKVEEVATGWRGMDGALAEQMEQHYERLIERAMSPTARRNYAGQKTLTLRRWSEQSKVVPAFERAKAHLDAGGSVIIMAETDKAQSFPVQIPGARMSQNDKGRPIWLLDGAITRLAALFERAGVPVAHVHDTRKNKVADEVDKFQRGEARVVLATPKSGGAGINLDDTVGNAPRLMIALSPELAGDVFDQVLGRVSRKTTQSEARVELYFNPDSFADARSKEIRDRKIRTLRAIQGGEDVDGAAFAGEERNAARQRQRDEDAGRIDPTLLVPLARAALGGALGALEGDTPEERMAFAFAGALGLSVLGSRRLVARVKAKLAPAQPSARPRYAFDPGAPMVLLDPNTGLPIGRGQLGALEHVRPIEMPELVQLTRQLTKRDIELKRFPAAKGMFRHRGNTFLIALDRRIFRDPIDAQKVLAHEIGHLIDYLDDKTMERGNILGRIASLREYLSKTLPDTPWNPNGALTPKERARIRSRAESEIRKSLGARPPKDEEADRAAWNAAVAERYAELIEEEIDTRKLIREQEARAELIELTEWWTPFDREKVPESYIAYRESSRELYAEALSVMLNAPDELRQRAPIFWKSFTAYFDRKPEAKQALQDLWTYLHQGKRAVIAGREERLKAGFATAEEFLINHARERDLDRSTLRGIIDQTKQEWWNIYHPIVSRAKQAKAAGATLRWHEDPEMFFDAHPLAENDSYLWLERLNRTVFQPLEATGLTRDDLGLYLFHNRVLNEAYTPANQEETGRSLIANPQGITPLQARVHLMNMRLTLGPQRMQVLEAHARQLQESFFELVRDGHAAGVFTDAQLALARDNRTAYAPFAIVDYLADSDHVPAGMKKQLGTLKDTANPALVFALKGLALQKLAQFNRAKAVTVDLLRRYFSAEIEPARVSLVPLPGGGVKRVPGPAPRGMETLTVLRKGVPEYWHVQPNIVRMFDDQMPASAMAATRVLNYVFRNFLHHAFITYNPGFVYATNPVADNLRSYFALPPGIKRRQWIAEQRRAWDMGREHVTQTRIAADMPRRRSLRALRKRRPLTPAERKELDHLDAKAFSLELLAMRAIASPYDNFMEHAGDQTGMWGRMLQDYSLIPDEPGRLREWLEKRAPLLVKLAKRIERDGLISEVMPKGAAYRAMVQGQKWQRKQAAAYVRNHIGTPNIYKRGSRGVINGTIFPYMNVFLRGLEADAVAGAGKAPGPASSKRKASEFWFRMGQAILTPGLMQALAAAGMLGAGLKEIYDAIPEYDKTNYLVVPLGKSLTTRAEDYKAHYLRIRIPETARLLNAALFHAVNRAANEDPAAAHSLTNLFAFGAGQVPGVHPLVMVAGNWTAFASGYTPVDWHRGQPVVSAADWKAGGWDRLQGMIGYTWDEMGLGGFVRWDPRSENVMEFTASATPVLNRLIRSSDAGLRERNLRADRLAEETYYKIRAAMPDHVNRLLQEYNSLQRMGKRRNTDQEMRYRELGLWHSKTWAPQLEMMREAKPAEWSAMAAGIGIDSEPFVRRSRE